VLWPLSVFCCRSRFVTEGRAAILAIVIDEIGEIVSAEEIECRQTEH